MSFDASLKLGIISGGQLGKMLCQAASEWGIDTHVMDTDDYAPAKSSANSFTLGDYKNYDDVYKFGKTVDLLTIEIEHVNIEALFKLKEEGLTIYPDPRMVAIIKDKGLQKNFYQEHGFPSSKFILVEDKQSILSKIETKEISFPFVQKSRTDGYDGKGVQVVDNLADINKLFDCPSVIEECIAIHKELALIVARNVKGEISTYPVVEMEFNPQANLVEQLICPANISKTQEEICEAIARNLALKFNLVGVLAVEFFLTKTGEILINEVAPRPHNSGHQSIEANFTSQYQQHLRAILNLPLGSTRLILPTVMINLLGEANQNGKTNYHNFDEVIKEEGVFVHLYGKKTTKPFRKMGHITILADTLDHAKYVANKIKNKLKIMAK